MSMKRLGRKHDDNEGKIIVPQLGIKRTEMVTLFRQLVLCN